MALTFKQDFTAEPTTTGTISSALANAALIGPELDYSRGTAAMKHTSDGTLIFEGHNLFLQSEDLNTTWSLTRCTIDGTQIVAPDGTTTADGVVGDTQNLSKVVQQTVTVLDTTTYIISFYAKSGDRDFAWINCNMGDQWEGAYFDLTDGSTAIGPDSDAESRGTVDVGSGWYRCWVKVTTSGSTSITPQFGPGDAFADRNVIGDSSTSNVYLWGLQIERNLTVQEYVKTTTVAGYAPRFACHTYNGSTFDNEGYHAEPASTNVCLRSQDLTDAAWSDSGDVTSTSFTAPDGGTTVDRLLHSTGTAVTQNITTTSSGTYTISAYVHPKPSATYTWVRMEFRRSGATTVGFECRFNLSGAGTVGTFAALSGGGSVTTGSATIVRVNTSDDAEDWYHITATGSLGAFTDGQVYLENIQGDNTTNDATDYRDWFGIQLETNSINRGTSYIPTLGASVTRNKDILDNGEFSTGSSWGSQTVGTFVLATRMPTWGNATYPTMTTMTEAIYFSCDDDSVSPQYWLVNDNAGGPGDDITMASYDGASVEEIVTTNTLTAVAQEIALTYDQPGQDIALSIDGATAVHDASAPTTALPSSGLTHIHIGNRYTDALQLGGFIKHFRYWDTHQADAFLESPDVFYVTSSGAITAGGLTLLANATQTSGTDGTGAITTGVPTVTASATNEVTSTGAVTSAATSMLGTASSASPATGTGTVTTGVPTVTATGVNEVPSTSALTTGVASLAGTGLAVIDATSAMTPAAFSMVGTAVNTVDGIGSLSPATVALLASVTNEVTSTSAVTLDNTSMVGTGNAGLDIGSSADITVGGVTLEGGISWIWVEPVKYTDVLVRPFTRELITKTMTGSSYG